MFLILYCATSGAVIPRGLVYVSWAVHFVRQLIQATALTDMHAMSAGSRNQKQSLLSLLSSEHRSAAPYTIVSLYIKLLQAPTSAAQSGSDTALASQTEM